MPNSISIPQRSGVGQSCSGWYDKKPEKEVWTDGGVCQSDAVGWVTGTSLGDRGAQGREGGQIKNHWGVIALGGLRGNVRPVKRV